MLCLVSLPALLFGQTVSFVDLSPPAGPLTVGILTAAGITNISGQTVSGVVNSVLMTPGGEVVVEVQTRPFDLGAGEQRMSQQLPWIRQPQFGQSEASRTLATRGRLTSGAFVVCYEFIALDGTRLGRSCFEKQTFLNASLSLLSPIDGAVIQSIKPTLIWEHIQSFSLSSNGLKYELSLVELFDGQSPAEAIERNPPLLYRRGLGHSFLYYPIGNRDLEFGKSYAWKVSLYRGKQTLLSSQVWSFAVERPAGEERVVSNGAYAMPTTTANGRLHQFSEAIRIGFDNNEGVKALSYRIIDLSNGGAQMDNLPPLSSLVAGLNVFAIPTADLALIPGNVYQLEMHTSRKLTYFIKFRFAESTK
ncbi:hypothetical protein [Lewinella sp. IMCC34191]|uniref:hypothetical protein n=1 Tax=Lewinella sp. IMCC34191 TaxID=2259172 RepID=UPI000E274946|nr:hypothetical protein [Lewinella sp. IMCC34191]